MEYTDKERQMLSLLERTDFKNLSKNDLFSYASKLGELRPEVAKQVVAQFPELVALIKTSLSEYKELLEKIVASDDKSINHIYTLFDKEIDNAHDSWNEYIAFADKVRIDLSMCLDKSDLSSDEQKEIIDREIEILRMVGEKDSEIRNKEMETAKMADKKDSEKRAFNWKIISSASMVVLVAAGIGLATLGGDFNFKLPKKS